MIVSDFAQLGCNALRSCPYWPSAKGSWTLQTCIVSTIRTLHNAHHKHSLTQRYSYDLLSYPATILVFSSFRNIPGLAGMGLTWSKCISQKKRLMQCYIGSGQCKVKL